MNALIESTIRLKSFSILEKHGENDIELSIPEVELGSLNLFMGDNAQGKTRLVRIFKFMKELMLKGSSRPLSTNFSGKFKFELLEGKKNICMLNYEIKIVPSNEGNYYLEKLEKDGHILLSTGENKNTLYDEQNDAAIDNFFVPSYTPALTAITDPKFKTIKQLREFFLRILILDLVQNNETIQFGEGEMILNPNGTNLSSVLFSWNKKWPNLFQEIIDDFKRCFSMVQDIRFQDLPMIIPNNVKPVRLVVQEEDVKREIPQGDWSAGFGRTLNILCLPKSQFDFEGKLSAPSLICIDEVDNSLDFKTLKFIINYLKDYSTETQFMLSSHSPIMSEFIHPRDWHIVRRKGSQIKISKPAEVESNLDEQLDFFRQKYWDFYTKHVSGSELYDPK